MTNSVVIIQPPLVQLNGPYPSGAYLAAFFRRLAAEGTSSVPFPLSVRWIDAGNLFFHELFSSGGLSRLFSLCRDGAAEAALKAEADGSETGAETAYQIRRYLSMEDRWVRWIDPIVSVLCGGDRELCHALVRSPYAPRGARMDAFLSGLEAEPTPDDARLLATLALEDLADFIAACFDSEFSLVRYAESIAASERRFARVEGALDRPMVRHFLEPLCDRLWRSLEAPPESGRDPSGGADSRGPRNADRILFCLSVPFPGCLVNAIAMARSIRRHFGDRAVISLGGGYVNTELRSCDNDALFSYIDFLCFDRGFGAYAEYFRRERAEGGLYPVSGDDSGGTALPAGLPRRLFCPEDLAAWETGVTGTLVPDYSDLDFSRYPRLADDPNPMHRLWADGAWIKAFLAHGCYWHRCSFCDVSLDYICAYHPVAVPQLYRGLRAQALAHGVRGVHLVDEAAPPRALRDFAAENLSAAARDAAGGLLSFWGNIRFEKTFNRDLADYLAAGGLVGVSGGIEIASPEGFKSVDKGIDLENLVSVCAAFKEAGVLVHSYLIYGYWNEDAQGIIDAAEVMRQLFAAGLVDSAFWHKFVLTRHSRVYREWQAGMHRSGERLEPVDERGDFADNDLRFAGEEDSRRYTAPLDAALGAWMSGEGFDTPVRKWFPFPMPSPRIAGDLIDSYIAAYEERRNRERGAAFESGARYAWIGSRPVAGPSHRSPSGESVSLVWWHLGEEVSIVVEPAVAARILAACAPAEAAGDGGSAPCADSSALAALPRKTFKFLRGNGLVKISPLV